jgi:anti-sigma factor RsiW
MNCTQARRLLSLDLDGELSEETAFELSRHLDGCRPCAERFAAERELERGLTRALMPAAAPDASLWRDVEQRLRAVPRRRPRTVAIAGAIAGALLVVAAVLALLRADRDESLRFVLAAMHEKVLAGTELPQAAFDDAAAAAAFFRARVAFPVHVGRGVDVRGGRVCTVRGQKLALLFAQDAGKPVSVFTIPAHLLDAYPEEAHELRARGCLQTEYGSVAVVLARGADVVLAAAAELPPSHLRGVLGGARK